MGLWSTRQWIKNVIPALASVAWKGCVSVLLLVASSAATAGTTKDLMTTTIQASVPPVRQRDLVYFPRASEDVTPMSTNEFRFLAHVGEPAWAGQPDEALQVRVQCNAVSWELRIRSENLAVCPAAGQWGGARSVVSAAIIAPMGWRVLLGPVAGGPTPALPGNEWTYVKDRCDDNYNQALSDGYLNVAFGGVGYTRVVMPNNIYPAGDPRLLPALALPDSPFYLYTEASFENRPAGDYIAPLVLELVAH